MSDCQAARQSFCSCQSREKPRPHLCLALANQNPLLCRVPLKFRQRLSQEATNERPLLGFSTRDGSPSRPRYSLVLASNATLGSQKQLDDMTTGWSRPEGLVHGRHLRHLSRICGLSLQKVELQSLPCAFERQTARGPGCKCTRKVSCVQGSGCSGLSSF